MSLKTEAWEALANPRAKAGSVSELMPGVLLCLTIAVIAAGIQTLEERSFGHPYIEALVLAILFGLGLRTVWQPSLRFQAGIAFSAKQLLEVAVALLGATVSVGALLASGPALLAGIVTVVVLAIGTSYGICRALGLPARMALLVACGNAICGNSAIAAVAPVIGADSKDVAAAIAFTAVLGVLMVLGLPLFVPIAALSQDQYGILAGLTVYAVPQVLAATVPVGLIATQVGTLVKLVRVLMLGPVVVLLSLIAPLLPREGLSTNRRPGRVSFLKLVPWFISGFLTLAGLCSMGLIPGAAAKPLAHVSGYLTIVAMAALGVGVDVRVLARVGGRVTAAVTGSLLVLVVISLALIYALGIL